MQYLTCRNQDWTGVLRQRDLLLFAGELHTDLSLRSLGLGGIFIVGHGGWVKAWTSVARWLC